MAKRFMTVMVAATAAVTLWAAAGCTTTKPEVVKSTGPRPPTQPDQVKIYQTPPLKYERLGVVSVPVGDDVKWDAGGNADLGFERLKAAAAARGANGLLLTLEDGDKYGRVLAGYKYQFYQVPVDRTGPKTALAEAIFVLKDYK